MNYQGDLLPERRKMTARPARGQREKSILKVQTSITKKRSAADNNRQPQTTNHVDPRHAGPSFDPVQFAVLLSQT